MQLHNNRGAPVQQYSTAIVLATTPAAIGYPQSIDRPFSPLSLGARAHDVPVPTQQGALIGSPLPGRALRLRRKPPPATHHRHRWTARTAAGSEHSLCACLSSVHPVALTVGRVPDVTEFGPDRPRFASARLLPLGLLLLGPGPSCQTWWPVGSNWLLHPKRVRNVAKVV